MTGDGWGPVVPVKEGEGRVSSNRCPVIKKHKRRSGKVARASPCLLRPKYVNEIQTAFVCLFVILFV